MGLTPCPSSLLHTHFLLYYRIITFIFLIFFRVSFAIAGVEWVFVEKIFSDDNKGIIVRTNGEVYLIEKGVGCFSFWRYEGKRVLIVSPGKFLGIGAKLILPENSQQCRILDYKLLGREFSIFPKLSKNKKKPNEILSKREIFLCQLALQTLGYDIGKPDGIIDSKTKAALLQFQKDRKLTQTGQFDVNTIIALSKAFSEKFSNNIKAIRFSIVLLNIAKHVLHRMYKSLWCEDGHWISSVINSGEFIVLEDGSVWQVDVIDRIDAGLWLPFENVIICNESIIINIDNGEKINAIRIR